MAHLLSKDVWKHHLASKDVQAKAEYILGNMTGYRMSSKWRADDVDGLRKAIEAIYELGKESAR